MFNVLNNIFYNYYLSYISYKINNIKNINDITFIIKNISFFYKNTTSDTILNILSDCFKKYPLKEEKMRTISILRENYEMTNGIEDYCCIMLWLAIIYSINNNSRLLL